jgi:arylsulfatase A-like enzyme
VVVITSDHGEQFGEHGIFDHGNSLYLPVLHVPLLISFPSHLPADATVRDPVSLSELPATVIDLVTLETGAPSSFPGTSLARHWNTTRNVNSAETEPVLSEVKKNPRAPKWEPVSRGDMRSVILDGYHYIQNGDDRNELYDFEVDPLEKHDLARSENHRRIVERFSLLLKTTLK